MRRILTLNDLYAFYSKETVPVHYSAADDNTNIVVQVPGTVNFSGVNNAEGLLPVVLQSCHTEINANNSNINEDVMVRALPSFSNRPILGYIHDVDGQPEFYTHNMHQDDEGNVIYDEVPIGIIPESCEAKLEYDKEKNKTYVVVKGYIFEEYSKAAEIIQREEECSVSVELSIRELSYDAKEKVLNIEDFFFSGVTILGKTENGETVQPGMKGSNIKLADFSAENSSAVFNNTETLVKMLEEINEKISNLNINSEKEEGGSTSVKLEELLAKYEKTVEDLDFDYENMSDEELEAKFEEVFGEKEPEAEPEINCTKKCSIQANGKEYNFEVSLDDKLRALESLVNDSYSEQDNAYYCVKAYENYVVMIDYWTGRAFKQSYKSEEDIFSLTGDRVEVYCTYLTREEENAIDEMRSNYEAVTEQLKEFQNKEAAAEKEAIFVSEDYDCIRESESFTQLVEKAEEYSVEEIQKECDALLLAYVKENKKTFAVETKPQKKIRIGAIKEPEYKPYGTLFN